MGKSNQDHWFKKNYLKDVRPAYEKDWETPIPTQVVSNGEYMPPPQSAKQKEVEARIKDKADVMAKKLGVNRRDFLKTASGMAAAFLAMNEVYGRVFDVDAAEAVDLERAEARHAAMADQFVFDDQTHHVRDDYAWDGLLFLRDFSSGNNPEKKPWNPALVGKTHKLTDFSFENYLKEIFLDSDTSVSVLSGFTSDDATKEPVTNAQIVATRDLVNKLAGTRRIYAHGLCWPPYAGNLEKMDYAAKTLKIDSWKSYTVGDPLGPSKFPWRLDDEKVTYPCYALGDKVGIRNWCVHKGLIPPDYKSFKNWQYANVDDLGKAAQDWPQMNFLIYHAALRPAFDYTELDKMYETSGEIPWIDDMAAIPRKFNVENVYPEIGSTFASTVITHPKVCSAILARLIAGAGADHVLWGSDSIWYGSPQWQLEAFRRIQITDDVAKKAGLSKADQADFNKFPAGRVKSSILGYNSARLYNMPMHVDGRPVQDFRNDGLAKVKAEYLKSGANRDNMYYGWIRKEKSAHA
jgi:hypothetical protein